MSGVVQTYCVLSEFMCNWCLELFRLIMSWSVFMCNWCLELFRLIVSSLCSCVCLELFRLIVSVFMCIWCLELFRLIVSSLWSCVTDVWNCSDLLFPLSSCVCSSDCVTDVWVVQTYCVLSEFMCNWCLEFLRLIMSGLCSCVTDVA